VAFAEPLLLFFDRRIIGTIFSASCCPVLTMSQNINEIKIYVKPIKHPIVHKKRLAPS